MDHLNLTPQPIDKKLTSAAQLYEVQLLQLSGLKTFRDLRIEDVPIDFHGPNYIHTVQCGEQNSVDLVLLHTYLGSGVTFYRMIKYLSKSFRVYLIDLLGMGLSSRPKFTLNTTKSVVDFFIDSIEKWRIAKGLKKFQIMGHSLGGYIACHYALKYPDNLLRVSLLSSAGITKHLQEESVEEFLKTLSFPRKTVFKLVLSYWEKKTSPQSAIKSLGFVGRGLMSRFINNRFQRPKEESEMMYNYFVNVINMPESSDMAVFYIFKPPRARAVQPLEEFILDMKLPVDFYYGDKDWMDSTGAKRVCEKASERCNFYLVKNAGHNSNIDNPEMLSELLINNSASLISSTGDKTILIQQPISMNGNEMASAGLSESLKVQENKEYQEMISVQSTKNESEFSKEEIILAEASNGVISSQESKEALLTEEVKEAFLAELSNEILLAEASKEVPEEAGTQVVE